MTKRVDRLTFDYSASSPQTSGFFNCRLSGLRGGILSAILPVLCHDIAWNSGIMRAVEVIAPEGCVVNARRPAPCGAATIGGSWMVENTASAAIANLVSASDETRSDAMAGTCGSISIFHIAGLNQYGKGFGGAMTEVLTGGGGATAKANGLDSAGPHNILTYQVTNVEGDKFVFPLLYLSRFANADGGGAGRKRGGLSGGSAFTLHGANFLHGVLVAHSMGMPTTFGLHGGCPRTIAAAAIGGDQQAFGVRVTLAAHEAPPASDGVRREGSRIVVDADAYPTGVVGDVVDAVGHGPAEFGDDEVMHPHFVGRTLWPPFASGIPEVADEFLLLRVDRNRWLARRQALPSPLVDVVELRVAIGMARSLARLTIGLQAVIELVQELAHQRCGRSCVPCRAGPPRDCADSCMSTAAAIADRHASKAQSECADRRAGSHPSR